MSTTIATPSMSAEVRLRSSELSSDKARVRLPLLGRLLDEQQDLTAVERFARKHDRGELPPDAKSYAELIPLAKPRAGEQYAFDVNLDACTGCKACVTACHRLNGLDDEEAETWRTVGLLHGGRPEAPVQQTVTTACHHCVEPACMKGCPVSAYEKDPVTGIVRHLDDQCIGCQYCTLACPYEVPQYSKKRGIVRKCDMCSDRLAEGEAPACVQACPNDAISIRIVNKAQVVENAQSDQFLPGAPSPGITIPTTMYRSQRAMPKNLLPADFYSVRQGHQHMPLVFMLVLTQLSVGTFLADFVLSRFSHVTGFISLRPYLSMTGLAVGVLALMASTLHLGRPQYAFRAVIGLRTSWLSREILAFGAFAFAGLVYAASFWQAPLFAMLRLPPLPVASVQTASLALGVVVGVFGLAGVLCSVMVYQVTGREWWGGGRTAWRFMLTCAVLGPATTMLVAAVMGIALGLEGALSAATPVLASVLTITAASKLIVDGSILVHLADRQLGELKRTAVLLRGPLRQLFVGRMVLGAFGGLVGPLWLGRLVADGPMRNGGTIVAVALLIWVSLLFSELLERALFFKAVSSPKMPGAFGT